MRKIIVLSFITLDGVVQAPGGPGEDTSGDFKYGGWIVPYFDDVLGAAMGEQMKPPFELLLGRKTYEIFAGYWPQHGDAWPGVNETKKYVASNSLTKAEWQNAVVLNGDVVEKVKQLKEEGGLPAGRQGPNLQVHGSGNFIQTLLAHDLVDELWLKTFPITLGKGKKLFTEGAIPAAWQLTDSKVSPKGVIIANYKRAGAVETGSF